ncbi:MAG: hypothetical protein KDA37_09245, partial [Planctomycetales bacterium]|nr:hypothetical protein [Planctomycetales bacterium]
PWTMDGRLSLQDGTAVSGSSQMSVTGELYAGSGDIDAPVAFEANSSVVVTAGKVLELNGGTTYRGGEYRGATIQQDGPATVTQSTTLGVNHLEFPANSLKPITYWLDEFDWDGSVGVAATTSIGAGATFTINAVRIDGSPSTDGYDGTLNIDGGKLIVNTGGRVIPKGAYPGSGDPTIYTGDPITSPTPWRLDGVMNLRQVNDDHAVVGSEFGSPLQVHGTVNVLEGGSEIISPLVLTNNGQINIAQGAWLSTGIEAKGSMNIDGLLVLSSPSTMQPGVDVTVNGNGMLFLSSDTAFYGGSYQGSGRLAQNGSASFQATTELGVYASFETGTNVISAGKELRLGKGAEIKKSARFSGGAIHNLAASTLTLQEQADLDTLLSNDGRLAIGELTGDAKVDEFVQTGSGSLEIELRGFGTGMYDRLIVEGSAQLAGELAVSLLGDFVPAVGDSFDVLFGFGGLTGRFDSVPSTLLSDGSLVDWGVSYVGSEVTVEVLGLSVLGVPGDYNNDGIVNAADYTVLQDHYGEPAGVLPNDPVGGAIGSAQYQTWAANYGRSLPANLSSTQAVPEPGVAVLLLAVFGAASFWGRTGQFFPGICDATLRGE